MGIERLIEPNFEKREGLIVAIAQDAKSGEVIMQAYMNKEAFLATQKSRLATY